MDLIKEQDNRDFKTTEGPKKEKNESEVTDAQLIQKIRAGDQRAFDLLYKRYEKPLYQFVRRYLKNEEEAEEVFHEVFMKVLSHDSLQYVSESVRGWLYVTARNMSLNRLRKRTRTTKVMNNLAYQSEIFDYDFEDKKIQKDLVEKIGERSQGLNDRQQKMLEMRLAGMTNKEIAEVQGVPEGTIKSRFHTIVNYLRKGFA